MCTDGLFLYITSPMPNLAHSSIEIAEALKKMTTDVV